MNCSALILAGGKSSRMGRDKALLELRGATLLAHQIKLVRNLGVKEIFISGRPEVDYAIPGCGVLIDRFQHAGPLAGIERGLDATTASLLLVLAVDMPALRSDFLARLGAICSENCGAVPQINERLEPLVAFYPKAAARCAVEMLSRPPGARTPGPTDFAKVCVREGWAKLVAVTAAEGQQFANLNSLADVRELSRSVL